MLPANTLETERLLLSPLSISDASFIAELVNTEGWLRFIGERNVHTPEEAQAYVQKLMNTPTLHYKVVKLKSNLVPVGIITFIKRDYLANPDIGFAFLPAHGNQGYAPEASKAVLLEVAEHYPCTEIMATTVPENVKSIRLLEKLGLKFSASISQGGTDLHVYAAAMDPFQLGYLTKAFFSIFTNSGNRVPDWQLIHKICLPQAQIIKKAGASHDVYSLESFVSPRKQILSDGTLTGFEEKEIFNETKIAGRIAQRYSRYEKSGILRGKSFLEQGHKMFQFIKTAEGWKISSMIWEDDQT